MSSLDKWNKNRTKKIKNKVKYQREGTAIDIRYWDKSKQKEKLDKLAKYFMIGGKVKFVRDKDNKNKTTGIKQAYSSSLVVRDIVDEYLNRDDIKELLEQIDKENK